MGKKQGIQFLRFLICFIVILVIMICVSPKAI